VWEADEQRRQVVRGIGADQTHQGRSHGSTEAGPRQQAIETVARPNTTGAITATQLGIQRWPSSNIATAAASSTTSARPAIQSDPGGLPAVLPHVVTRQ
jgi:hypothetical protein